MNEQEEQKKKAHDERLEKFYNECIQYWRKPFWLNIKEVKLNKIDEEQRNSILSWWRSGLLGFIDWKNYWRKLTYLEWHFEFWFLYYHNGSCYDYIGAEIAFLNFALLPLFKK